MYIEMSEKEIEEKIVQKAHWVAQKFRDKIEELGLDELTAYVTFEFSQEEYLIFRHNQDKLLKLFVQIAKQDLQSLNK